MRKRVTIGFCFALGVAFIVGEIARYWIADHPIAPTPIIIGLVFVYIAGRLDDPKGADAILEHGSTAFVAVVGALRGRRATDRATVVTDTATGETSIVVAPPPPPPNAQGATVIPVPANADESEGEEPR